MQGIKKPPGSLAVFLVSVAFSSSATLSIRQRCEKRIKPKIKAGGGHGSGCSEFELVSLYTDFKRGRQVSPLENA
jgi:hypothetical protein